MERQGRVNSRNLHLPSWVAPPAAWCRATRAMAGASTPRRTGPRVRRRPGGPSPRATHPVTAGALLPTPPTVEDYSAAFATPTTRVRVRIVTNSSAEVGWVPMVRVEVRLGGARDQGHRHGLHHLRRVVAQDVRAEHALARLVHHELHQRFAGPSRHGAAHGGETGHVDVGRPQFGGFLLGESDRGERGRGEHRRRHGVEHPGAGAGGAEQAVGQGVPLGASAPGRGTRRRDALAGAPRGRSPVARGSYTASANGCR